MTYPKNLTVLGVGKLGEALVAGLLPLPEVVTGVLGSLEELACALRDPDALARDHCKLLVKLGS